MRAQRGQIPLPVTVLQLLTFDVGSETLPSLALGRDPAKPGIMEQRPRAADEPLIKRPMLRRAWLFLGRIVALLQMAGEGIPSQRVVSVAAGSPAAGALKVGDEVVSVDGVSGSPRRLQSAIRAHRCAGPRSGCLAATRARFVALRDGRLVTRSLRPRYVPADRHMELGFAFGETRRNVGAGRAASLAGSGPLDRDQADRLRCGAYLRTQGAQAAAWRGRGLRSSQMIAESTSLAVEVLALISLSLGIVNLSRSCRSTAGRSRWRWRRRSPADRSRSR